ncbi:MAG: inorganic diphosphatase [Thermoanaerobaculia bacterium]
MTDFVRDIDPVTPNGALRVVIDTPKGNRNKYKWDEELGLFRLTKILPPGFAFPWNYGFLPKTCSGDGDPLDALVFMEEPVFCGCVILARVRGVIVMESDGDRNDRIVASPVGDHEDRIYEKELPERLFDEIGIFFEGYHRLRGETTKILSRGGPDEAMRLIEQARKKYREG